MKMTVETPVRAGQSAICTVTGKAERGSIEVMIEKGGNPPAISGGRHPVKALPTGNIIAILGVWEAGDRVEFILRDSNDKVVDSKTTIVI